ncbi:hypothetical protein Tco_0822998 [Tanacetum coccineum]|uniref:Uncharacterized protein n=1 Tax=Tanacetum coccineum TaxID=301880 RepID=A0ABQ5AL81_9ASTR
MVIYQEPPSKAKGEHESMITEIEEQPETEMVKQPQVVKELEVTEPTKEAECTKEPLKNLKAKAEKKKNFFDWDTDPRNFNVFKEFKFGDIGMKSWLIMLPITRKKKNKVVPDLINSLRNKYKKLRTIGESLQIDDHVPLCWELCFPDLVPARKIYIKLGSTSGIRACRETLNYPIWEVIQRGNGLVSVSTDINGVIKVLPPKTEAIKSRFGGNDESKKMQKYILKQQFEDFSVSNSEGLHKGYNKFQSLLSQLEIHGAGISTKYTNQKFLRSLPSAWSQVSLIMRTKPGVDSLSFDDLCNNLKVFESDVKGSTASSASTQNVAFVFENTSSTNEVSITYGASSSSGHNP